MVICFLLTSLHLVFKYTVLVEEICVCGSTELKDLPFWFLLLSAVFQAPYDTLEIEWSSCISHLKELTVIHNLLPGYFKNRVKIIL